MSEFRIYYIITFYICKSEDKGKHFKILIQTYALYLLRTTYTVFCCSAIRMLKPCSLHSQYPLHSRRSQTQYTGFFSTYKTRCRAQIAFSIYLIAESPHRLAEDFVRIVRISLGKFLEFLSSLYFVYFRCAFRINVYTFTNMHMYIHMYIFVYKVSDVRLC